MIIGLTGKNGAGKTEVSNYLVSRGFEYHSLSDEIRAEVRRRGLEITREILTECGNELRSRFGAGILAERILAQLGHDRNYVIDSIRNPAEVDVLRRRKDFKLLGVDAGQAVRFERSRERGREGAPQSLEQFICEEEWELQSPDPVRQQLVATRNMADVVVANDGTLEDLHRRLAELLPSLMSRFDRPDWDDYFMTIARVVASRSNCIKRKVAAIIVTVDRRVISTGYNGTPARHPQLQ